MVLSIVYDRTYGCLLLIDYPCVVIYRSRHNVASVVLEHCVKTTIGSGSCPRFSKLRHNVTFLLKLMCLFCQGLGMGRLLASGEFVAVVTSKSRDFCTIYSIKRYLRRLLHLRWIDILVEGTVRIMALLLHR